MTKLWGSVGLFCDIDPQGEMILVEGRKSSCVGDGERGQHLQSFPDQGYAFFLQWIVDGLFAAQCNFLQHGANGFAQPFRPTFPVCSFFSPSSSDIAISAKCRAQNAVVQVQFVQMQQQQLPSVVGGALPVGAQMCRQHVMAIAPVTDHGGGDVGSLRRGISQSSWVQN